VYTGVHNGVTVRSDNRYIQGMFAAGAANYMDCVDVHYTSGTTEPSATSGHPADDGQQHYSWHFLPMLELYWNTFNPPGATKSLPLCFTEIGYATQQGLSQTLVQAGAHGFLWAEGNTLFNQGAWLADALQRACHSSKVKRGDEVRLTPLEGGALMRPIGANSSLSAPV
jgi:hypothetical protein